MVLLVIDDDVEILNSVVQDIKNIYPTLNVVAYSDYEKLMRNLSMIDYQYVLSDVFIGKTNGIEVHNQISKNGKIPVAYMSGADPSEFDVYDAPHVYFLKKPIDKDKLKKALDKMINYDQTLKVKAAGRESFVNLSEIIYLESDKRLVHIVTENKIYNTYAKLDEFDFLSQKGFVRIGKSTIVNKAFIKEKTRETVILTNGEEKLISRRYQKDIDDII